MPNVKLHLPFALVCPFGFFFNLLQPQQHLSSGRLQPVSHPPDGQGQVLDRTMLHMSWKCGHCESHHILTCFVPAFWTLIFLMPCDWFQDTFKDASHYLEQRKLLNKQIPPASSRLHFTWSATGSGLFIQHKQSSRFQDFSAADGGVWEKQRGTKKNKNMSDMLMLYWHKKRCLPRKKKLSNTPLHWGKWSPPSCPRS